MVKSYSQKTGTCKQCCLFSECKNNEVMMVKFLAKLGISCVDGDCLEVVEG